MSEMSIVQHWHLNRSFSLLLCLLFRCHAAFFNHFLWTCWSFAVWTTAYKSEKWLITPFLSFSPFVLLLPQLAVKETLRVICVRSSFHFIPVIYSASSSNSIVFPFLNISECLKAIVDLCVVDASVRDVCIKGDNLINEETSKVKFNTNRKSIYTNIFISSFFPCCWCCSCQVFKKEKEMKKGIAFPTCLSVNNCICHYSPAKNDPDYTLKDGDLVKM